MADLMNRETVSIAVDSPTDPATRRTASREPRSPIVRRQRLMLGVACTTAVLSTMGLIASTWVRSPAEMAARTGPPPASVLTAPVEAKVLQRTVILRGEYSSVRSLTFTPSTVLSPDGTAGRTDGELLITRSLKKAGDQVRPGMLIAEVSYRPVFAMRGRIPALRDLVQGMRGRDVTQLQQALAEAGYRRGSDREGYFGVGTAAALKRLYEKLGYAVPTVPGRTSAIAKNEAEKASGQDIGAAGGGKRDQLVMAPKSEVMFVPSFPARIVTVSDSVGTKISKDLLKLAVGGVRLIGRLNPSEGDIVEPGHVAEVLIEEDGSRHRAAVAKVGDLVTPKAGSKIRQPPYIPVTFKAKAPWKAELNGKSAQITVTSAATSDEVLTVPLSAITAPADGKTSVTVITGSGERRRVRVAAGASADGYVEVTPEGGDLREGDQVVVGR
ncbi:peptidoglycan-binding protein [Actinomadura livida]|uniref:Peptidoglycan binding-like domain-containing protein n=2 Tax=Actinomadura livida TaxID=79909 RepID=A0A7W7IKI0_9ACTN|nr:MULTISPECIES: peptidoglycan-binding protein [Actinomadura]MBB4778591.1 hypothetical protein [Actinomadura catellatispora]